MDRNARTDVKQAVSVSDGIQHSLLVLSELQYYNSVYEY